MGEQDNLRLVLQFLSRLKKNNNKQWFEKNKEHYQEAMEQFESLIAQLITRLSATLDLDGVTPKECVMRIYRDVRFSKDKSPYKTGMGAGIVSGGRKSGRLGYHMHVEPNGATMVAGGLWDPTPQQLLKFRAAIDKDPSGFKRILASKQFKTHFGKLTGATLKTTPQGYAGDHPEIELLRRKQICVMEQFEDDAVVSSKFPHLAEASIKAMKPFIDYLNQLIL